MSPKHRSDSAFNPDQPQQPDNVAVNDRIAARGADYERDDNDSAEGNDAALIAGPSFVRRVNADGTVEAVPAPVDTGEEQGEDESARAGKAAAPAPEHQR
ncbi:hypothetical protein [Luteimonas deserti]|uniref:Uncharacterized protein n=1 Tax=Luteimonas deserti TaxID=2752306 RepID=A0A7Z0TU87_9GAMM|nr:hypothetical protein [Luteimonas deserti]NYZ62601.1 hypothetical protein [Luteimonas deserti]